MIVALASEHRRPAQQLDQMKRLRWAQARIDNERRMAINPAAKQNYIDDATRQMLPPLHIHRPTAIERKRSGDSRSRFWRELGRGRWRSKTIDETLARCRVGGRRWAVAHPYGPQVEPERIVALMADIKRWRDGKVDLTVDEKFRFYNPRAVKQIAHMLTLPLRVKSSQRLPCTGARMPK